METDLTDNGSCTESQLRDDSHGSSALIFLGTGCSSMVPSAMCLIQPTDSPCSVCTQALTIPPECNPNYRCNTSLLIDYCNGDREHKYILIDVGKTFREQVIRWFTCHKIPHVDSIILTHEHADAVLGLDDIRAVQPFSPMNDIDPTPIYLTQFSMGRYPLGLKFGLNGDLVWLNKPSKSGHFPAAELKDMLFARKETFGQLQEPDKEASDDPQNWSEDSFVAVKFPYLVQKKLKEGQEIRRVAQLDWKIIEGDCDKPFVASGLQFVPLPVMHGEDYVSLGFLFGEKYRVAYISDVSRFPPSTEYVISKSGAGQLDLLILDTNTLYKKVSRSVHFCLPQTLDAVKRICPKRALLVGMSHEFDHQKDNEALMEWSRREGILVQLAQDGLRIPIEL